MSRKNNKKKEIIAEIFTIYHFPDKLASPGHYTFPFNILIPDGLPSTVYYSGGLYSKATIKYIIKAVLIPEESAKIKNMVFENELAIREVPPVVITDINFWVSSKVKSWMGFKKHGIVNLNVKFEKDWYTIDEVVTVNCDIDNQWNIPVKNIKLKLKQYANLKASSTSQICLKSIKWKGSIDGIGAKESTEGYDKTFSFNLGEIPGTKNTGYFHRKFGNHEKEKFLTEHLQPTTNGKYVKINYKLSLELDYGIKSRKATRCEIPLYIQVPEPKLFNEIEAPPDLNPSIITEGDEMPNPEPEAPLLSHVVPSEGSDHYASFENTEIYEAAPSDLLKQQIHDNF